ncbi:hypothetical protein Trydic_g18905 [Trypoxylus dichotomus]
MNDDHDAMFELLQKLLDCKDVTMEDFIGWLDGVEKEELLDSDILNLTTIYTMEEDDNANDEIAEHKLSHDEGRQVLEKALEYIEPQANADVLLLRRWKDYAVKNRSIKQSTLESFLIKL